MSDIQELMRQLRNAARRIERATTTDERREAWVEFDRVDALLDDEETKAHDEAAE